MKYEKGSRSLFTKLSISLNRGSLNQVLGVVTSLKKKKNVGYKVATDNKLLTFFLSADANINISYHIGIHISLLLGLNNHFISSISLENYNSPILMDLAKFKFVFAKIKKTRNLF